LRKRRVSKKKLGRFQKGELNQRRRSKRLLLPRQERIERKRKRDMEENRLPKKKGKKINHLSIKDNLKVLDII